MSGSTWKEVLKAQHDDLERMQEMDAALNQQDVVLEADKVLKRNPGSFGVSFGASNEPQGTRGVRASRDSNLDLNLPETQIDDLDFDQQVRARYMILMGLLLWWLEILGHRLVQYKSAMVLLSLKWTSFHLDGWRILGHRVDQYKAMVF